jgi:hypothetical protein
MRLAIKKDFDYALMIRITLNMSYSFLFENGGLFLFCSWMSHRDIGIAEADERMVLWDHPIISCSGVFVRHSSQMKNLSSKTNPL